MGLEIEVELKIPSPDWNSVVTKLLDLGARETKSQLQYDAYLDRPYKSFADTDEALRLRKRLPIDTMIHDDYIIKGPAEITYKGPKIDSLSKTRVEHTIHVEDAQKTLVLFEHLGFRHVLTVVKKRVYYLLHDFVISIDDVKELGVYVELEQVVESESMISSVRDRLFEVARSLGLRPEESIRESYLELLLSVSNS